jgi:hypothetical protein
MHRALIMKPYELIIVRLCIKALYTIHSRMFRGQFYVLHAASNMYGICNDFNDDVIVGPPF